MSEHEQIVGIISAKNRTPLELDPRCTALLVVDMQRYFTQPSFPFTDVFEKLSPGSAAGYLTRVRQTVIPSIQRLLNSFRAAGSPVVFTAVGTETGDGRELPCWLRSFDELGMAILGKRVWPAVDDPSWAIDDALTPLPGEVVLNKLSAGTFATTGLEQRLRHQRIENVVVTGVSTDVCVTTTSREAADRGFKTIVVSDGCTTLSDTMHRASLETFNLAFGWVRTANEVVALLATVPRPANNSLPAANDAARTARLISR
ncbi:MAG TPA: isochorismatase family cysteine hydrolase [Gemmatimonadaceae bacterium]|nr:isochorismatase family cysteine hydrolase [Gemmatimonadaceae bacterium]